VLAQESGIKLTQLKVITFPCPYYGGQISWQR